MTRLFSCAACQTAYVVSRHSEPSPREPRRAECSEPLPDRIGEEWLHYQCSSVAAKAQNY